MTEEQKTYSIVLRVQRVTYEDAYVAVPVTDAIIKPKEDGSVGIDFDAFTSEAIKISTDQRVEWKVEACQTNPHPTQTPVPEDRNMFDAYYSDDDNA